MGELAAVIGRIRARDASYRVSSTALVVKDDGQRLTYDLLRQRFAKAREAAGLTHEQFQMRGLRAKAGTDRTEDGR